MTQVVRSVASIHSLHLNHTYATLYTSSGPPGDDFSCPLLTEASGMEYRQVQPLSRCDLHVSQRDAVMHTRAILTGTFPSPCGVWRYFPSRQGDPREIHKHKSRRTDTPWPIRLSQTLSPPPRHHDFTLFDDGAAPADASFWIRVGSEETRASCPAQYGVYPRSI